MWPQLSIKPLLANNLIKLNTFENLLRGVHFRLGGGSGPKMPIWTKSIIMDFFFIDVAPYFLLS